MLKVRLKNTFAHPEHGAHPAGTVILLPELVAKELVKLKFAEAVDVPPVTEEAAPKKETAVKKPDVDKKKEVAVKKPEVEVAVKAPEVESPKVAQ